MKYIEVEFIHEWMGHQPGIKLPLQDKTVFELEKRGVVKILDSGIRNKSIDSPVVDKMVKNAPKKKMSKNRK